MLQVRPLPKHLQKTAERDLNEIPSRIQTDINHIRSWLAQQPHIRSRTDDQWILNFLRGCKFSLERTKEKLDLFYTMRSLMPEFFTNRDPLLPEIQEVLNNGLFLPLPKTIEDAGPRIILGRFGHNMKLSYKLLAKTFFMIIDIMLWEDDNFVVGGQHIFADGAEMTLEYLLSIDLNDVKKLQSCLEIAYPSRPQGVEAVNIPLFAKTVFNWFVSLLGDKIKERVHFYASNNVESVYDIIPRSYLPKEYCGECISITELTAFWKQKVESYRDWLLEEDKYGVDESKRPGEQKTAEELFGIQGSFRKLDVD